ncbi:MAG: sulfite reductase flavoprotein subunit alpha [Myxococcota bacterium]|nr:sulfite reductase flavoprotein subunit alpha [Myxococcota bacterium]
MAVTLLFGTETGNAEDCAETLGEAIEEMGIEIQVVDMEDYEPENLVKEQLLVIVTSTYGNGDPPANAEDLLDHLRDQRPGLPGTPFAVCALGDRTYARFCQCGKDFDAILEELGGQRQIERVDCDADFEPFFDEFREKLLEHISQNKSRYDGPPGTPPVQPKAHEGFSARRPFNARLLERTCLNPDSPHGKTWHYRLDLSGSGMQWHPGDSFGVLPQNDPQEVQEILQAARLQGGTPVTWKGHELPLAQVLGEKACLQRISADMLRRLGTVQGPARDAIHGGTEAQFTSSHHIIDALRDHPLIEWGAQELVDMLRQLAPRLYSVASSAKAQPDSVDFCVATTRFEMNGRKVKGVATCWMEERLQPGDNVPLYVVENRAFRLPDPSVPIIMVGPGTGIAPFRGFLQDRIGSGGKSWLFFGHRNQGSDFLYQDELQGWLQDGTLTKLSCAWSRDQAHKVYVQDKMEEAGAELWSWIHTGATVFVCGDAGSMAPAVEDTLARIAQTHGGHSDGKAFLAQLEAQGRYLKDVY